MGSDLVRDFPYTGSGCPSSGLLGGSKSLNSKKTAVLIVHEANKMILQSHDALGLPSKSLVISSMVSTEQNSLEGQPSQASVSTLSTLHYLLIKKKSFLSVF